MPLARIYGEVAGLLGKVHGMLIPFYSTLGVQDEGLTLMHKNMPFQQEQVNES